MGLHREDFPTPDWPMKQAREHKAPGDSVRACVIISHYNPEDGLRCMGAADRTLHLLSPVQRRQIWTCPVSRGLFFLGPGERRGPADSLLPISR